MTHSVLLRKKLRVSWTKSKFKSRNLYLPWFDFYKEWKSVRLGHLTSIYDVPVGFVGPHHLMQCITLFAVAVWGCSISDDLSCSCNKANVNEVIYLQKIRLCYANLEACSQVERLQESRLIITWHGHRKLFVSSSQRTCEKTLHRVPTAVWVSVLEFNVTCNDISVIYIWRQRCAGVVTTVGLPTP